MLQPIDDITKTQLLILYLLYRFRFLTKQQIQHLLKHKDIRRIKAWLLNLKQKKLIKTRTIIDLENSGKTVYFLTVNSRELLKGVTGVQRKELDKIKREHERTDTYINHCLFLVELYFKFIELVQDNTLYFFTQTDMTNFSYFFKPFPTCYIAIEVNGTVLRRYFLEVFDQNEKKSTIKKRIQEYFDYYTSNEWEEQTNHPFPKVLIIAPNKDMKDYFYRIIKFLHSEEGGEIEWFLATKKEITFHGVSSNVWQKIE